MIPKYTRQKSKIQNLKVLKQIITTLVERETP
jgi:hypothetical protein